MPANFANQLCKIAKPCEAIPGLIAESAIDGADDCRLAGYGKYLRILQRADLEEEPIDGHVRHVRLAERGQRLEPAELRQAQPVEQIGRASCRERVCQYE